jgi:hypothetical protein
LLIFSVDSRASRITLDFTQVYPEAKIHSTISTTPTYIGATMLKDMTTEEIAVELWDLYKDAYGVRPRHFTEEQLSDRKFLEETWKDVS